MCDAQCAATEMFVLLTPQNERMVARALSASPTPWCRRDPTNGAPALPPSAGRSAMAGCGLMLHVTDDLRPRLTSPWQMTLESTVIRPTERASFSISVCSGLRGRLPMHDATRRPHVGTDHRRPPGPAPGPHPRASLRGGTGGPGGRLVERFQVVRVGSSAKRAVAAILGGDPLRTNS